MPGASDKGQDRFCILVMFNWQEFDSSRKVASLFPIPRLLMTTTGGAACLMQKLESFGDDQPRVIALAAQMSMLARLALDEIRGIDAESNVAALGRIYGEVHFLGMVATKIQLGKPIPEVPDVRLLEGLEGPPSVDQDIRASLNADMTKTWQNEPEGWKKHRLYKHVDTLSEHLFNFGSVLEWSEAATWGVLLQGCLDIPMSPENESVIVVEDTNACADI